MVSGGYYVVPYPYLEPNFCLRFSSPFQKRGVCFFRVSFSYLQVFFLRIAITFFNHCVPKSHALFVVKLRFGLFYLFCIENIFVSRFIHYKLLKSSSSNNIIIVNAIMRRKHHCTLTIPTLASSAPIP